MPMVDTKIVLISETGYSPEHDTFLYCLLKQQYELFCVVGKDCELWEEVMDELAVGDGTNTWQITTTSHVDEGVENVVKFAESWPTKVPSGVRVVSI
ncbi:hypothetical protein [Motilimonas pumila]|uniref:Uncharacterized protein n=1 Tax=Motilimonas pumila TaxID=2303987 RepID=A0A418Y9B3_9GAMM|nr:hypothetical protein [Motilimonas pumila]RJG36912.1 hypothetical protein D1Z90_20125 [Motilimonas pumila]